MRFIVINLSVRSADGNFQTGRLFYKFFPDIDRVDSTPNFYRLRVR